MTLVGTLEEQAKALERDAAALRKLIEAARELGEERVAAILAPMLNGNGNGHAATMEPEPHDEFPRGREAVRIIVGERPGIWTLVELRAEMKRRGFWTSDKGVDVAVARLVAGGEARRAGKGRYVFFDPATEERDEP